MKSAGTPVLRSAVRATAILATLNIVCAQTATLLPAELTDYANFGLSSAVQGTRLVAGAPFQATNGLPAAGGAYVYDRNGGAWTESAALVASDIQAHDRFGIDVALDGDTLIVGAESEGTFTQLYGAAYVFVRSAGVWTEQAKLIAPVRVHNSRFGGAVALSGDTAVVGALQDSSIASLAGSVHVFVRNGGIWSHQAKLTVNDVGFQAAFGYDVALDGDMLLAGAPFDSVANFSGLGSVHVFERSGTSWTKTAKLQPTVFEAGLRFGAGLALCGARAVAGSYSLPGKAFVLERANGAWSETATLQPLDPDATAFFGFNVALDAERVAVGATYELVDVNGALVQAGAAYVFDENGTQWRLAQQLFSPHPGDDNAFGGVALDGATLVVGEMRDDPNNRGTVFVYELGGLNTYCTAGTSTQACSAHVSLAGTPSISSTAPALITASGVGAQTNGVVFIGATTIAAPWASASTSRLCVAQPLARVSLEQTSGGTAAGCDGVLTADVNSVLRSQGGVLLGQFVLVGATVHAQAWYRDPPAPKGSNLSDALSFSFYP